MKHFSNHDRQQSLKTILAIFIFVLLSGVGLNMTLSTRAQAFKGSATTPFVSESSPLNFVSISHQITRSLNDALTTFERGEHQEAASQIAETYFELFDGSGIEDAIAAKSSSLKSNFEAQFNAIRSMAKNQAPLAELSIHTRKLHQQIEAVALQLSTPQSGSEIFLSSFLIIFREGFEAILVITAIAALLIKTKNRNKLHVVKNSVLSAVFASLVTAALFQYIFHITRAQQELMEGVLMLLACTMLFMVGHWLISQSESLRWQGFLKHQLHNSIGNQSQRALWITCFVAVYREGAETVLFYQALWTQAPQHSYALFWGLALGSVALMILFYFFKQSARRIPMRPFFRITSTLLYALAFVFAGRGVIELQAGGYLSVTRLEHWPTLSFAGIYPTLQSIGLQALLLIAFLSSLVKVKFDFRSARPKTTSINQPEGISTL